MALTPDDVVNKRFQPTKFREGYDQDEVDDFLDEVVEELRRLTKENEDLKAKLAAAGGSTGETSEGEVPAPVAVAEKSSTPEPTPVAEPTKDAEKAKAEPEKAEEPVAPAAGTAAPLQAETGAAGAGSAESAAGVLAMAQRLHDEYVTAGATERDRIVSEAQEQARGLVSDAETAAAKTTQDAEENKRKTLADLESKKGALQEQIEKLRGFERDYRSRLRTYIQGQLKDLDSSKVIADEPGPLENK